MQLAFFVCLVKCHSLSNREKVSKEKAPPTPTSSAPVQPSTAPQDENPKVLLRHASTSLIPNFKEGDEKQLKVEMILKNIKQQRQVNKFHKTFADWKERGENSADSAIR